jgi:radical SAM superfamily enzyme YgiQ (UPF0313 family)
MQLSQNFMVLNRNEKLIISQISGVVRPMIIHEPDLLIMSYFFKQNSIDDAAEQFVVHPWVQVWLPNVRIEDVKQRINQLSAAQLFESKTEVEPLIDFKKFHIDDDLSKVNLPEKIKLSVNAAISISEQGFFIYSGLDQQPRILPLEWVMLMLSFGDGVLPAKPIKEKDFLFKDDIALVIKTLFKHGILIECKPENAVKTVNSIKEYANIATKQSTQTWQDIEKDQRIPVYFVTHMENHYPLALGVIYSALKNHNNGLLLTKFNLIPITYLKPQDMISGPYQKFGCGVWLFSNYMWSIDVNLQISKAIKAHSTNNLTIHGGPSTPEYKRASEMFMSANSHIDVSVHGEGEVVITEIFNTIDKMAGEKISYENDTFKEITGLTFRDNLEDTFIRTPKRTRTATPDEVPSPYLSGIFDVYEGQVEAAIIESNRGCPFGCTFCDWGSATNQKVRKFDLERVKDEIKWIGENKVRVLWIADANYGMYDRDIELSKYIIETKEKYGYPQEVVVNYTKNSTWRLVEIIKIFSKGGIMSQGIMSIQTTDSETLDVINRKNIKTEKYDELVKVFYDLKLPLSTDLMIGLPGITVAGFNNDLQRYIDMDVSVKAYPTQLLPNSPMADPDYVEKYKLKVDKDDFLISSYSYTESDFKWMKGIYRVYMMADGFSLLRYVIRYLQWEHDIRSIDFLNDLLSFVQKQPAYYQQITFAVRFFNQDKCMPGGWTLFYKQIGHYIQKKYSIPMDSGLQTILRVNQLCMPDDALNYPLRIDLAHDFTAYYSAKTSEVDYKDKPLTDYPPAKFHVSDPNSMTSVDMDYTQYDSHQYFWELHSEVSRPKSISEYA